MKKTTHSLEQNDGLGPLRLTWSEHHVDECYHIRIMDQVLAESLTVAPVDYAFLDYLLCLLAQQRARVEMQIMGPVCVYTLRRGRRSSRDSSLAFALKNPG